MAFAVRMVDEDPAAFDELVARGLMRVPVTLVDDRVIVGDDEPALRDALGRDRCRATLQSL